MPRLVSCLHPVSLHIGDERDIIAIMLRGQRDDVTNEHLNQMVM